MNTIKSSYPSISRSELVYGEAMQNIARFNLKESQNKQTKLVPYTPKVKPEILFITSYPPRECGIATYTQDLKNAIQDKFGHSLSLTICALETKEGTNQYPQEVKYTLQTDELGQYVHLMHQVNADKNIKMVFLQHEFGLYGGEYGNYLLKFMANLKRPITTTFHTVLPNPNKQLKRVVRKLVDYSDQVIVMTQASAMILMRDYGIAERKITVIAHGTHLVAYTSEVPKKARIRLADRIVLSTFGLVNEGKSIETALDALPEIIQQFPQVIYLVIGKTHPEVLKREGEKYREFLQQKVVDLQLQNHVRFINRYLSLDELNEQLQRTDMYLFTSKDPNQAVSGTLAYAMACGCPILSTPIPHARELLDGVGFTFDFENSAQLAEEALQLLRDPELLNQMHLNALHKINQTAWENSALAHIELTQNNLSKNSVPLQYEIPVLSLAHLNRMTTGKGIIQFAKLSTPDFNSGYTLDDNARALIAMCKHYAITGQITDLELITTYLDFVLYCQQSDGSFLNYVDYQGEFMPKNANENLEDANGRAIWALGELLTHEMIISSKLIRKARMAIEKSLSSCANFQSPRAMAFAIKGLYLNYEYAPNERIKQLIIQFADNLVSKYRGISEKGWNWFEDYLTYANSVLPEALLYASLCTGSNLYKNIAYQSFTFLLSVTFRNNHIKVISNQGWHLQGKAVHDYGEQPVDVAYTILALHLFYAVEKNKMYLDKLQTAFDWFLGKNHLHQIIYNPKTGGCYDGLEEHHVNLNQGAESTISYLMARLVIEDLAVKHLIPQYDEDRFAAVG
jgi:glycosyltransferase involved in cell wall biosynthesis